MTNEEIAELATKHGISIEQARSIANDISAKVAEEVIMRARLNIFSLRYDADLGKVVGRGEVYTQKVRRYGDPRSPDDNSPTKIEFTAQPVGVFQMYDPQGDANGEDEEEVV